MNKKNEYSNTKVLCVDDEQNILNSLQRTLGRYFQIHTALNGKEALDQISQFGPFPVVITDYNMPEMTGLTLLQEINKISPDTIQIMLTGTAELGVAIHTVNQTNIFRFLAKPCKTQIIRQAIDEALEHYHLHETQQKLTTELAASHAELTRQNQELEYQLTFAQTIFSNIITKNVHPTPGLDIYLSPMESVGGDIILSSLQQNNMLYVMLGDVTGHGLPAAIVTLLISDTFNALSAESCSIETMAQGINHKICQSLPIGLFCAALLVQFNYSTGTLTVWQGGLPDAYLLNKQGAVIETIHSKSPALGILANKNFAGTATEYHNQDIASLFACSDGLTEQMNPGREMFGETRLLKSFIDVPADVKRVDHLIKQLEQFREKMPQSDDISLFELDIVNLKQTLKSL